MSRQTAFPESAVPLNPDDPLFGLMAAFKADDSAQKVDLGIGAYRDNSGKPWVLPTVKKVKERLNADPAWNHEYLPITGLPEFRERSRDLVFGPASAVVASGRVASVQAISGTGALHLGALFLSRFYSTEAGKAAVYLPSPTWTNHHQIFDNVGTPVRQYPYFLYQTNGLNFDGMVRELAAAPRGSIVILHACAHNPTGVDLAADQWDQLVTLVRDRALFPFFDTAYQGFASGDLDRDAAAIRLFADAGLEFVVAQSYAKNMGLYGERVGCFHYVAPASVPDADVPAHIKRVTSQLALLSRSEISNPPSFGARIVASILGSPDLFDDWKQDLKTMAGRIAEMRLSLRSAIEKELAADGVKETLPEKYKNWEHITNQIGMFSFTGLSKAHVDQLRSDFHIYMTSNGRVSMAGFNTHNVDYVAKAIVAVVSTTPADGKL